MRLLIATQVLDLNHPVLGFFHAWVAEFAKQCESVIVVASFVGEHHLPKNVTVYTLGKEVGLEHRHRVGRFVALMWSLRHEYDAVFVHMIPEFVVAGTIPWKLSGKKVGLWYLHGAVSLWLRLATLVVDFIVTASPESCRVKSRKVHVVGHGIEPIPPRVLEGGTVLSAITIGRVTPIKRIEVILDAIEMVRGGGTALKAEIVGGPGVPQDAEYFEDMRERAEVAKVTWRGPLKHHEAMENLRKHDLFISASETGSVDKAVLEGAMAGVLPIYSNPAFTAALGIPELQVSGTPESYAELIQSLADDPHGRATLAQKAQDSVKKNHSLEGLIPKILKFYA